MTKKLVFSLYILHLFALTHLTADDTYWDSRLVPAYFHNSDLQRRWAWAFLASNLQQLKGDEHILDIGCGDGKITADICKFVPQGTAVGIDPSVPMLDWAIKQYCPQEYPNLAFAQGGFLNPNISELFDIIISNCALQHCSDQLQAFENIAKLLKPNGKLWIMIPALDNPAWQQARQTVQTSPKWASYWQNIPPRKFLTIDECTRMLKENNFYPQRIEKVQTLDPFIDRKEFLDFLLGTFTPAVPADMAREFYNEMIDEYLRLYPEAVNVNGVVEARFNRIEIEAVYLNQNERNLT
ncbi:MAG TPA: methyltransferase domain-containing protein [Chlamydiales bacterium]|nr:methyltransferase domain-containing protein [Chlamydiales bacterium]